MDYYRWFNSGRVYQLYGWGTIKYFIVGLIVIVITGIIVLVGNGQLQTNGIDHVVNLTDGAGAGLK